MRYFLVLAVIVSLPAALSAQEPAQEEDPVEVYGGGAQPAMRYENDRPQTDLLRFEAGYEPAYDDNPLLSPTPERHDVVQTGSLRALMLYETSTMTASFEYTPFYQFYSHYSDYSRFQQTASADVLMRLAERWSLRIRNDFRDQTGAFFRAAESDAGLEIGSPTGLNQTVYLPLTRERQEVARADLLHDLGPHHAVDLFAAYDRHSFPRSTEALYGSTTRSAGGEYTWRMREHASLGLLGTWEQLNVSGGVPAGAAPRLRIASLIPTIGWRPRAALELTAFVGPQWVTPQSPAGSESGSAEMRWAAGGTLAKQTERATAALTVEHKLNDGGGLMTYVVSSSMTAAWRRRIHEAWELRLECGASRNRWYPLAASATRVRGETGSAMVVRSLGPALHLHIAYEFTHQAANELTLPAAQFDRNRIAAGVVWTLRSISLGR